MGSTADVTIHSSQFPENVQNDFLESLRRRQVNHKFHYATHKQALQWLALHQACSPSRNDADCAVTYNLAFKAAASFIRARQIHVIGLGCGGGQKDTRLLRRLNSAGRKIFYTPCDVSGAMVLTARQAALAAVPPGNCFPLVCDLATATDLPKVLSSPAPKSAARLVTFFGMIPNFKPQIVLPILRKLVRPADLLLFSANLAPGDDYQAGMKMILPQYDNALTRDWLMTFLHDVGIADSDGKLRFSIETVRTLKRIVADFVFVRTRTVQLYGERFRFKRGESVRLFFSYRYTPVLARSILARHGLRVLESWMTKSGEEGVFLCGRGGRVS
ncbi:MAG TPA: L-histidine N(alpha)-methyltransferase [Verrucomicrobiae bacterium]|nr:L-histidine N(alpha)-methyltransferase [Verrucomicrobiae bacterium]